MNQANKSMDKLKQTTNFWQCLKMTTVLKKSNKNSRKIFKKGNLTMPIKIKGEEYGIIQIKSNKTNRKKDACAQNNQFDEQAHKRS